MSSYRNSEARPPIMRGTPPALRVPRAEWDQPPWNRWSFQHVRELLPTVEVRRGEGSPSPLGEAPVDLDDLAVPRSDGQTTTLAALLDDTFTDGFIVRHRGRVAYERYFNGMTAATPHLSQSVAKSITGAVAGILAGQGVIDPGAPVSRYVPEFEATAWRGATLQHVLDMTSGVAFNEDYTDPASDIALIDYASGWKEPPGPGDWPACVFEVALRQTRSDRPHGERFVYRSIETDVLAFCLERATGARLADLVSELLWRPMGAQEHAFFTVDPAGYALADGGFNACLRDYLRFGALILEESAAGGRQVVPAGWISETRRGDASRFGPPYTIVTPNGAYHNCFWVEDVATGALVARGVFGQMIHVDFAAQMVVAKLSSWPDFLNPRFTRDTLAAIHAIGRALA